MVEKENIDILYSTPSIDFTDIVHDSQKMWRENKRGIRAISESVELPPRFSAWFSELMFDHLPDYIANLRPSLEKSHPPPIISMGYAADKRMFTLPGYGIEAYVPSSLQIREEYQWTKGMELLDEFAIDTLATEIIHNIFHQPIKRKDIEIYPWKRPQLLFPSYSSDNKAVDRLKEMFNSDGRLREFQKRLVRSSLLCDETVVNEALEPFDTDIDNLAVELGNIEEYNPPIYIEPTNEAEQKQRHYSDIAQGITSKKIPGVINLTLRNPALLALLGTAGFASDFLYTAFTGNGISTYSIPETTLKVFSILSSLSALLYLHQLPKALVHEWNHYLFCDNDHFGLRPIQYSMGRTRNGVK